MTIRSTQIQELNYALNKEMEDLLAGQQRLSNRWYVTVFWRTCYLPSDRKDESRSLAESYEGVIRDLKEDQEKLVKKLDDFHAQNTRLTILKDEMSQQLTDEKRV